MQAPFEFMNPIDSSIADALKRRLPEYLNAIGHCAAFQPSGARLKARCPLHLDTRPSLAAKLMEDGWVWFCHPCGRGGTVIDLHAFRTGRDPKLSFRTILEEVAAMVDFRPGMDSRPMVKPAATPSMGKTSRPIALDELESMTSPWRCRLYEDTGLREAFASQLGLAPETIRRLTMPSLDAFGIAPAGHCLIKSDGTHCRLPMPRLVYIGEGGYKVRDPFGNGKVRFWRVGQLHRPWRSHWLLRAAPVITDVHLVESESTAAALIEAGYEDPFDQGACVVAASGSNGFDGEWLPLFRGRRVHFWPDNDVAGSGFFEKTAALLHGKAQTILKRKYLPQTHE